MRLSSPPERRLLRTKHAAEYLCMSEWKLRQLIQNGRLPYLHEREGAPFQLDIRDLDEYIERNKHHGTDDIIFRPLPRSTNSTSSRMKGDNYAPPTRNRKPVSAERQRGVVDEIPPQRKIVS